MPTSLRQPRRREPFGHSQRGGFIGFKSDFLRQHDVARDKVVSWNEAPANDRSTGAIQLGDIRRCSMPYAVSSARMAADDIEIVVDVILRQLLR